jgi:hypothetical protein
MCWTVDPKKHELSDQFRTLMIYDLCSYIIFVRIVKFSIVYWANGAWGSVVVKALRY